MNSCILVSNRVLLLHLSQLRLGLCACSASKIASQFALVVVVSLPLGQVWLSHFLHVIRDACQSVAFHADLSFLVIIKAIVLMKDATNARAGTKTGIMLLSAKMNANTAIAMSAIAESERMSASVLRFKLAPSLAGVLMLLALRCRVRLQLVVGM